jgi:hypothetical protein
MRAYSVLTLSILAVIFSGCSSKLATDAFKKKEVDRGIMHTVNNPVSDDEAKDMLVTGSKNWALGNGLGDTALKVGTSIVFPPYLIYLLGNGAIEMAGYHGVYVTDALPDNAREGWNGMYDSVTSLPGRALATASGSEYRTKEKIAAEGGFWGRGNSSLASNQDLDKSNGARNESVAIASSDSERRNDLYGSDRAGS